MTQKTLIALFLTGLLMALFLSQEKGSKPMFEPQPAQKIPHRHEIHGDVREDAYFWMRDRDTKPVLDFLKQENERTAEALKPVGALEGVLYREIRSRIKEDDQTDRKSVV